MRPVALDYPAHFRIDRLDGVELLDLLPNGFELLWLKRASLVKLHTGLRKSPKPGEQRPSLGPTFSAAGAEASRAAMTNSPTRRRSCMVVFVRRIGQRPPACTVQKYRSREAPASRARSRD